MLSLSFSVLPFYAATSFESRCLFPPAEMLKVKAVQTPVSTKEEVVCWEQKCEAYRQQTDTDTRSSSPPPRYKSNLKPLSFTSSEAILSIIWWQALVEPHNADHYLLPRYYSAIATKFSSDPRLLTPGSTPTHTMYALLQSQQNREIAIQFSSTNSSSLLLGVNMRISATYLPIPYI